MAVCRSERKDSDDVIQTTVLDFDELESLSETMSLASSRLIFPGFLVKQPPTSINRSPSGRVSTPESPQQIPRPANGAESRRSSQETQLTVQSPMSPAPVLDLIDAPLSTVPVSSSEPLDTLSDPFSFMSGLEPLTITHNQVKQDAAQELESLALESPAESFIGVQQTREPGTWTGVVSPTTESPKPVLFGRADRGGPPMNEQTPQPSPSLTGEALKSIEDLSRLDQLFVQQIEDFLHFGYNANVYHKPSYL